MRWMTVLLVTVGLGIAKADAAQEKPCNPGSTIVAVGDAVEVPENTPALTEKATVVVRRNDGAVATDSEIKNPAPKWTATVVKGLRTAAAASTASLIWAEGAFSCAQTVEFSIEDQPPDTDDTSGVGDVECQEAGQKWLTDAATSLGRQRDAITMVVFHEDGPVCFAPTTRPTQGNPIYVGIFTDERRNWSSARITFQPCSLEPTAPNVLATARLPTFTRELQAGEFVIHKFPPKHCWDPAVVITVDGNGRQLAHTVTQATRYRATLHLGTVFTENHETTFGLRPESPTVNRVFAQGPVDKGPEYVAALVFYSLLRYIPPLGGRAAYAGRDPVRDNGFADKLGGVIGVGLRNPLKRFVTGFSFEVAAGVNVLTVWDWVESNVLADIEEGDVFVGKPEEIPTRKEWRQKFVIGVSMDLVYATNAFRR